MKRQTTVRPVNITGVEKWTANIDYLTCTTDLELDKPKWRSVAEGLRFIAVIAGGIPKEQKWQGYTGWRCGSMFYGERDGGCVLDVQGSFADTAWENIHKHVTNVSRLDICITAYHDWDTTEIIHAVKDMHWRNHGNPEIMTKPKAHMHLGLGHGDTYYVGSKTSNKMFRCYDKQRQSNNPEYSNSTRWEFQYRNEDAYRNHVSLTKASNRISAMAGIVSRDCEAWKIPYPYVTNVRPSPVLLSYQRDDLEGKKKWFREQVAAAIRRMGYLPGMEETMQLLVDTIRNTGYSST